MLDLAQKMEVKLPAMSQIVDRLVKRGMVERQADPEDRRVVRLGVTEKARALLDADRAAREMRMRAAARELKPDEMTQVIAGLELLATAADAVRANAAEEMPLFNSDTDPLVELMSERARSRREKMPPSE